MASATASSSTQPSAWQVADITSFLNSLSMPQYIPIFNANHIDRGTVLLDLDSVTLKELCNSIGDRLKLHSAICKLRRSQQSGGKRRPPPLVRPMPAALRQSSPTGSPRKRRRHVKFTLRQDETFRSIAVGAEDEVGDVFVRALRKFGLLDGNSPASSPLPTAQFMPGLQLEPLSLSGWAVFLPSSPQKPLSAADMNHLLMSNDEDVAVVIDRLPSMAAKKKQRASTVLVLGGLGVPPKSPTSARLFDLARSKMRLGKASSLIPQSAAPATPTPSNALPNMLRNSVAASMRPSGDVITEHIVDFFPTVETNVLRRARNSYIQNAHQSLSAMSSGPPPAMPVLPPITSGPPLDMPTSYLSSNIPNNRLSMSRFSRRTAGGDGASLRTLEEVTASVESRMSQSTEEEPEEEEHEEEEEDEEEEPEPEEAKGGFAAGGSIRWLKGAIIGSGSFGQVYLGMNPLSGKLMAVKQVEIPKAGGDDAHKVVMLDSLRREIEMLKNLSHENIVPYLGSFADDDGTHLNIFLEYISGGTVPSLISRFGAFEEPLISTFIRQTLQGLNYLHGENIIHRDIKGGNILVDTQGVVKITDFGISKRMDDKVIKTGKRQNRASLQGTVYWMSPEVLSKQTYTFKADIWSLGCLFVEMHTGEHPYPGMKQEQAIYQIGLLQKPPESSEDLSELGRDFLAQTFSVDIKKRPSAAELLKHPFLTQK